MEHDLLPPLSALSLGKTDKTLDDTLTTTCSLDVELNESEFNLEGHSFLRKASTDRTHVFSNEVEESLFILGLLPENDNLKNLSPSFKLLNDVENIPTRPIYLSTVPEIAAYFNQRFLCEGHTFLPSNDKISYLKRLVDPCFFKKGRLISKIFGNYSTFILFFLLYVDKALNYLLYIICCIKGRLISNSESQKHDVRYCLKLANAGNISEAVKLAYELLDSSKLSQSKATSALNSHDLKNRDLYNFIKQHCSAVPPDQTFKALKTTLGLLDTFSKNCDLPKQKDLQVENLLGYLNLKAGNYFRSLFHFLRSATLGDSTLTSLTNLAMLYNKFDMYTEMLSVLSLLDSIIKNGSFDQSESIAISKTVAVIISKTFGNQGNKYAKDIVTESIKKYRGLEQGNRDFYVSLVCTLAEIHIRLKEYNEASILMNEMLNKLPDHALLWFTRAKLKLLTNNLDNASQDILMSIKINPYSPHTHLLACKIFTKLNNLPSAWLSFKNCVYSDPSALEAHACCGQVISSLGFEKHILDFYSTIAWIYSNSKLSHMFVTAYKSFDVTSDNKHVAQIKSYFKKAIGLAILLIIVDYSYKYFYTPIEL